MKMLGIFASFDKDNIIDDYVVYYLKELSKFADIIYVADNYISEFELYKIKEYAIKTITIPHGEYDFGSYKRGYIYAKENNILENYDYLILCNDSNFGPIYSFDCIFKNINYEENTVYGVYLHKENESWEEHLQSHFVIIPKSIFLSDWYYNFIISIKKENDKILVVKKYEIGMSALFMNNGVNLKALYSFCDNLPTFHPLNLIKQHYMFLKKSCYNLNIKEFYEILDIIKDNYDINLILNYYSRPRYYNSVIYMDKIFQLEGEIIQLKNDREALKLKCGWFSVFNIYNNLDTLKIVIFGIKITIKISQENVENIAQFIPIRKWRNIFRNKFKIAEQSRAEQSRAEQSSSV